MSFEYSKQYYFSIKISTFANLSISGTYDPPLAYFPPNNRCSTSTITSLKQYKKLFKVYNKVDNLQ